MVSNVTIPNGTIVADNTVSTPVTSFDIGTNTWTTRVPPGYSSSDIFISGAIINSSTGFSVSSGNSSTISASFFSNKPSFSQSWFYGLAAYQPVFSYSNISGAGQVASIGGGVQAGTPIPEESFLVAGGSGGGGSNFTGSNSSTDNFTTCQKAVACNLSATVQKTDAFCYGVANGSATITLTGGVAPYSFSNSDGVFLQSANAVNVFNNVPFGYYPISVTDGAGCKTDLSVTISQPAGIGASGVVVDAGINEMPGSITETISGGTPPYSFQWNNGAQTESLTGLGPGTYILKVTDANGCTDVFTYIVYGQLILPPPPPPPPGQDCQFAYFTVAATALKGSSIACDGAASIGVSGGTAPYTYSWSDGVTTAANTRTDLCGLTAAGKHTIYTVVVTDANKVTAAVSFSLCGTPAVILVPNSVAGTGANLSANLSSGGAGIMDARVYPNPSNGLVKLLINSTERSNAVVNVIDVSGRVIKSFVINLETGINTKDLEMPIHARGTYNIEIKTDKETKVLPILLN